MSQNRPRKRAVNWLVCFVTHERPISWENGMPRSVRPNRPRQISRKIVVKVVKQFTEINGKSHSCQTPGMLVETPRVARGATSPQNNRHFKWKIMISQGKLGKLSTLLCTCNEKSSFSIEESSLVYKTCPLPMAIVR